jgi:prolyl 4-hydroxylase
MEKYKHMPDEWDRWLDASVDRDCRPADILAAMVAANYDPAYAEQVIGERIARRRAGLPAAERAPYRYGTPRIRHQGNLIRTSDRDVRVLMRLDQPVVAVLDNVLSDDECDAVVALARDRLAPSATLSPATGENQVRDTRTSRGAFLPEGDNALLRRLNRRIAQITNTPVEHGEALHVLHYGVGAEYKPHPDYFDPNSPGFAATLQRGGQRIATLIVYLNDVEDAGDTVFPKLGLSVVPKKGAAVYFEYMNEEGQLDEATLHGGAPVGAGEKWVLTKWVRQDVFR